MKKIKGCLNSINLKNIFKNFLWKKKKLTTTAYSWYDNHSTSTLRDARGKDRGSSLQEGASHTYTLRLC